VTTVKISREAFRQLTEQALVDLGAALDDIAGTAGMRAILTIIERLEADVAVRALDGTPDTLQSFQGQREALGELRRQLASVQQAALVQVEEAVEEERVPESELARFTQPGGADFG
jgi:hypothetical protein